MCARLLAATLLTSLLVACGPSDEPQPTPSPDPAPTPEREAPARGPQEVRELLQQAVIGEHRSEANRARDGHRNPVETLAFFGLESDHTVVELWPGAGWYTEILAPVLRERGRLVVANFTTDPAAGMVARMGQALLDKLEAEPDVYDRVEVITFSPPDEMSLGEADSADLVLISRHFHNLLGRGIVDEVLTAAFDVLVPGGTLGVLQHRLPPERDFDPEVRTGYLPESFVIEAAQRAGFELEARSEINANPLDTADHELGVWTLPPSYRACAELEDESEQRPCRQEWDAIGESDRMTLKFVKP